MDESCVGVVTEVKEGEIKEVDDQEDLSPPKVCLYKEENKAKVKQVVENKVTSNAGGRLDILVILGKESPDIAELNGEEDKPGPRQ